MIDVKNGKLSLDISKEKVEFNLSRAMANPTLEGSSSHMEAIDWVVDAPKDPLGTFFLGYEEDDAYND